MSRSARTGTPTLTVISWRDIPAQVVARSGRSASKLELPQRFQIAIDRAAMEAGLFGTDDYLEEWRKESRPCGDDLDAEVAAEVERIDARFSGRVLGAYANNAGHRPGTEMREQDS